jgi:hypothetical protein
MARSPNSRTTGSEQGTSLPDADAIRADADAVIVEVKDTAGKIVDEATDQVGHLADLAKEQVAETTAKVKGIASEQKDLLVAQFDGVADAAQRVASDLEQQHSASAPYARYVADNAGKLRDQLRDNDVDQVLAMAQDFGRKQPAAFIGATALLGFAASRFLLASAKRATSTRTNLASTSSPAPGGDNPGSQPGSL